MLASCFSTGDGSGSKYKNVRVMETQMECLAGRGLLACHPHYELSGNSLLSCKGRGKHEFPYVTCCGAWLPLQDS